MFTDNFDAGKFETLIEINTLINSDYSDPKALLTRILESATRLTNGEASSLLLLNTENNKLYFEIALGSKGPDVQQFSLNLGEGIAGWVAQNNRSLIVNDVDRDKRFFSDISRQIGYTTRSILAVPMRIKEECVGVIELINKRGGGHFAQEDLQWLEIFANQAALAIVNARSFQQVQTENSLLRGEIDDRSYVEFVGNSKAITDCLAIARKAAATDSSVLISGESGVGKELIAEQIHLNSPRRDGPFIRVNCAALPESLIESELFGHVKGAFTDAAQDRRGRFELSDGGTIFLDEIGEVPLNVQAKLLRVIQNHVFEKVGASEPMSSDVRILAATNRNLARAIEDGAFRQDLYYRLNVLPIVVPPLRDRREDIPLLAEHFLGIYSREMAKKVKAVTPEAMSVLMRYDWPGNVRELQNVIERAVVLSSTKAIQPDDLMLGQEKSDGRSVFHGKNLKEAVQLFKRQFVMDTIRRNGGVQKTAAEELGIQRTYLSRLVKELQIDTTTYKDEEY
jgi:Nif-specific regulatory protein